MPTILRWNGYRFYFLSNEGHEPPHVDIDKAGRSCKFWLDLVGLSVNRGCAGHEITEIRAKLIEQQAVFVEAWHEHLRN